MRLLLLGAILSLLAVVSAGSSAPAHASIAASATTIGAATTGPGFFPGDVNCSGNTDGIDSLHILNFVAGLTAPAANCLQQYGNVNCDAGIDTADSVLVLRYAAGLPEDLTQGCPAIGGPPTAEAVTRALNKATTAGDAGWVLKLIYQQLGVGLYTYDGQQIVAGAEKNLATDFYLYDFESKLMAGHYVERQLYGIGTLTLFLTEAGVLHGGQPLTDADVLSMLAAKVSASRADKSQFTWRLIDQLGLAHEEPLDLTSPGLDPAAVQLDSLQVFMALHDLTLPASTSASGEVHAAAGNILDLPTKALHDWATEAVRFAADSVQPTNWRPRADSTVETRTFTVTVSFDSNTDYLEPLNGPLAGFNPADFPQGVSGFPVEWYPAAALVPNNGQLINRATSDFTDSLGTSKIDFLPRVECPNASGAPVTATHKVLVEVTPSIKSVFPPHTQIGLMSVFAETEIQVSHHTGSASQSISSANDPLSQLPCTWKGKSHGTTHHYDPIYDETGYIDGDFTFGNETRNGNLVTYEIIAGSATWVANGHLMVVQSDGSLVSCPFAKQGIEKIVGTLNVLDDGSGHLTYSGGGGTDGQNLDIGCDPNATEIINTDTYFSTCLDPQTYTPGSLKMTGSCISDYPGDFGYHDLFTWDLGGISCGAGVDASPQGTCGGAVAGLPSP